MTGLRLCSKNKQTLSCCLHMGGALQLQHLISTLKLQIGTCLALAIRREHHGILIHVWTELSLKFLNFLQSLPKGSVQQAFSHDGDQILTGRSRNRITATTVCRV